MIPMKIYFPGGKRVYADFDGFTHMTDQPTSSGERGSAPSPFELFLAAMGTCAGIYVLGFCQQRGIDTAGLEMSQSMTFNPQTHLVDTVHLEIRLPKSFPEKYRQAIVQAAQLCTVKRHLETPPTFDIATKIAE